MVEAIRAHKAETPKQTSLHLRLRALHFYPDREHAMEANEMEPWAGDERGQALQELQR
jgi:hypothetical protein